MCFIRVLKSSTNTPLTLEERYQIKKLVDKGRTLSHIAKVIGRGKNTVVNEVRRNGGKTAYNPNKAHEEATERKVKADDKRREIGRSVAPLSPLGKAFERIESLEMHVEILTEEIRKLRHDSK